MPKLHLEDPVEWHKQAYKLIYDIISFILSEWWYKGVVFIIS